MSKPLCIYHANCDDGFAAAWAVRDALGADGVEFVAAQYHDGPVYVAGRDVIMVDFSYKRPVLEAMTESARSILILDHHKTAAEDLSGFFAPPSWEAWRTIQDDGTRLSQNTRVAALFDMNRSGAGLAWDYFHPGKARPWFINYIEDRDLWTKKLPGVDEFTAALRSYPMDFETWDELIAAPVQAAIDEGKSILRYYRGLVEKMKEGAYIASIGDVPCWIVNCSGFMASEVAGDLSKRGLSFGAIYFEVKPGEWVYSLRSTGDFDVSELAKKFGGGGHKNAGGFTSSEFVHRVGVSPRPAL